MKFFSRFFRIIRINFILARYNIDEIILESHWFYPIRFLIFCNPFYWTSRRQLSRGERLRRALEDLGPIFVKMGQIISTRRDILPDDIALELSKLQDRVPPFSGKLAKKMVEEALGQPIENIFSEFEMSALASASIAQVHAARLHNGEDVVIKVLRPHIKKIIDNDIDLLIIFAKFAEKYLESARRFKPKEIVAEIAQTLYDELDLMREAANASQLRRNFADSSALYIPKIFWDYCKSTVLVMERIYGTPIHDVEHLKTSGVNLHKLAARGIEVFFTQIFRDSFFHADLHPGNIFVNHIDPQNPTYIAVDFGIAGSLNHNDQRYLAENMVAFFKRDYQRVAELHIASGWLPPDTRIDQFEGAIRAVSEPIFERPLRDISFGQLLLRLFQVARRFEINIQPQLILLQKTLLNIEGLCRALAPDLDMWAIAAPQIEKWLKKQVGTKAFLKRVRENLPLWSEQLPELPGMIYEVLRETKQRQEEIRFREILNNKTKPVKKLRLKYLFGGIGSTLVAISSIFYFNGMLTSVANSITFGLGLFALLVAWIV